MAQTYNSSHSELKQGQLLVKCAALLRDELFSVIQGTVNTQHGSASKNRKTRSGSELSEDDIFHLPQVPDILLAGSSHGPRVTVVRPGSISPTPHLVHQPVSFNLSKIPYTETSRKDMDSEVEVRPKCYVWQC